MVTCSPTCVQRLGRAPQRGPANRRQTSAAAQGPEYEARGGSRGPGERGATKMWVLMPVGSSLTRPENLPRGALLVLTAALLFAGMAAAIRVASRELLTAPIVFFRHSLMLLVLAPWLVRKGRGGLRTKELPSHVLRGLAGACATACYFFAIARLRLADAALLNQSIPLFVPLVERAWLKEPIPPRLWRVLLIGFAGLLLILRPGLGVFEPVALIGLSSALFASVAQVTIRRLTRTEPVTRIVFYYGLVASIAAAPPAALTWHAPSGSTWAVLLLAAGLATAGQLALTRSYVYAPAARVGPFLYAGPVFAGLLDWLIWGRLPDGLFVAGAILVVAAATLALRIRSSVAEHGDGRR
jgi:drug/metabolite transporter (DMT)-like permease